MSLSKEQWERFEALLQAWANESLNVEETQEFQELLRQSPEARARYLRLANLDAGLREVAAQEEESDWGDQPEKEAALLSFPLSQRLSLVVGAAAALVLLTLSLAFWIGGESDPEEAMGQGFAILNQAVNDEWVGRRIGEGEVLAEGKLQLQSGLAQIEFFNGAVVVLEGPGELEILSSGEAALHSGKIRAQVPPAARGFTVRTPDGKVVDLGTEFGLSVSPDGEEIHVFDGEVELHGKTGSPQLIEGGNAVARGEVQPADRKAFVSAEDLDSQLNASSQDSLAEWQAYSQELRKDPRLIAYYPMDQPGTWNRRVLNETAAGSERDGAIVGAQRVEGRWGWPGKSALEFTRTGSRARVFLPGEYTSLTFTCWARIDSLDRQYNALFLTDSYQKGEPHWQIHHDGRILFSILVREEGKKRNLWSWSPPVWSLGDSGKWMHLAAVFDEPAQEVRHYANGELIVRNPIPPHMEVRQTRIGAGEIGNWGLPNNPEDPWFAIRNLNGRIDEFALFADALSDAEIAEMFAIGNPY